MEVKKHTPIETFKAQNRIEKLFVIKTTQVYNDENGQPTQINRRFATLTEDGEPYLWLTKNGAIAVIEGRKSSLEVCDILGDDGVLRQLITAQKRQVETTI